MTKWIVLPLSVFVLTLTSLNLASLGATPLPIASGSTAPSRATTTLVAVVDLPRIFQAHPMFKLRIESLQEQLKTVDQQLHAQQNELSQHSRQLADLDPQSQDYRRREAQLARRVADLKVQARQTRQQFLKREASEYHTAYQDIVSAVHQVAQQHHIALVLRCDSSNIDPGNPRSVANGLNRSIVLQRDLDITQLVIDQLQLSVARNNSHDPAPLR